MSVTFSVFGYFVSFQLFKNLFVPIERLEKESASQSLDDFVDPEYTQKATQEVNASAQ